MSRVDLCLIARQAAENLGPIAISTHKTLEVDEPAGPVFIRGNGFVVNVAISNLIENALNHSPPGEAVRIRVTPNPSVEIHDSGPGIPAEFREKIFERFWRGEASKEGAGLGLAIVRRIMHALNGTVSVADAHEGGALFTLSFLRGRASTVNKFLIRRARSNQLVLGACPPQASDATLSGICRPSAAESGQFTRYAMMLPPPRQVAVSEHMHYSTRRSGTGWG